MGTNYILSSNKLFHWDTNLDCNSVTHCNTYIVPLCHKSPVFTQSNLEVQVLARLC